MAQAFALRDCALVAIATGRRAQSLRELRDALLALPLECVYYHFWGRLLRPRFDDTEFHNDFANWARHALHDDVLSERLAVIDPADYVDLEALRGELVEVIEERLEEGEGGYARRERQFHFRRCQTVVFDTGARIPDAAALAAAIPAMSLGSIYYHVIDARRRQPQRSDDFRTWLSELGQEYEPVCRRLAAIDPYFSNLADLRTELAGVFAECLPGGSPR